MKEICTSQEITKTKKGYLLLIDGREVKYFERMEKAVEYCTDNYTILTPQQAKMLVLIKLPAGSLDYYTERSQVFRDRDGEFLFQANIQQQRTRY